MAGRFIGKNRQIEGGFMATARQDFHVHTTGEDWRHDATQTDMAPELSVPFNDPTVQGTLEKITAFLADFGPGNFVSIGNVDNPGDYNIGDTGITNLNEAFIAAQMDTRLVDGYGLILVKSGTYETGDEIEINAGISVMGEFGGTIINGTGVEKSIFILSSTGPGIEIGTLPSPNPPMLTEYGINLTKIFNLVLVDNLNGSVPNMTTVPMVNIPKGANVEFDKVTFLGKFNITNPITYPVDITKWAIKDSSGTGGTYLVIKDCMFDGLSVGLNLNQFDIYDRIAINGCRARIWGDFDPSPNVEDNCFAKITSGTINIINNSILGVGTKVFNAFLLDNNCSGFITGNSFTPYSGSGFVARVQPNLSDRGIVITANLVTNSTINNQWYMTIGDGINSIGDITGEDAFDVLGGVGFNSLVTTTLYVNPGIYDITVSDLSKFSIIGRTYGEKRPTLNISNDLELSNILQNVRISGGSSELKFNFPQISGNDSETMIFIDNCVFENAMCILPAVDFTMLPQNPSLTFRAEHIVRSCQFLTTSGDNLKLRILGPATKTLVKNCGFRGYGYAIAMSNDLDISYNSGFGLNIIDCNFDCTSITNTFDFGPRDMLGYIDIDCQSDSSIIGANILIENCNLICKTINSSLFSDNSDPDLDAILYFNGVNLTIRNSYFDLLQKTNRSAGIFYKMSTNNDDLYHGKLTIDNCNIIGYYPFQASGVISEIDILNCRFSQTYDEPDGSNMSGISYMTMMDFDVAKCKINLLNNKIIQNFDANAWTAKPVCPHHPVTESEQTFFCQGLVNIYGMGGLYANIENNYIFGRITGGLTTDNPLQNAAGLCIIGTTNAGFDVLSLYRDIAVLNILNNNIHVQSNLDSDVAVAFVTSIYISGTDTNILGNILQNDQPLLSTNSNVYPNYNISSLLIGHTRSLKMIGPGPTYAPNYTNSINVESNKFIIPSSTGIEADMYGLRHFAVWFLPNDTFVGALTPSGNFNNNIFTNFLIRKDPGIVNTISDLPSVYLETQLSNFNMYIPNSGGLLHPIYNMSNNVNLYQIARVRSSSGSIAISNSTLNQDKFDGYIYGALNDDLLNIIRYDSSDITNIDTSSITLSLTPLATGNSKLSWNIPLFELLPGNSKIFSITCKITSNYNNDNNFEAKLSLKQFTADGTQNDTFTPLVAGITQETVSQAGDTSTHVNYLYIAPGNMLVNTLLGTTLSLDVYNDIDTLSSPGSVDISQIYIEYYC